MIDIVFLLLCFFVTSQVFSQWESEIDITLPTAETGLVLKTVPSHEVAGDGAPGFDPAYVDLMEGYKWVRPGSARTSPLIWRILGRETSRPWDEAVDPGSCSALLHPETSLTEDDKRTLAEWIDLGALWDSRPGSSDHENSEADAGGAR